MITEMSPEYGANMKHVHTYRTVLNLSNTKAGIVDPGPSAPSLNRNSSPRQERSLRQVNISCMHPEGYRLYTF